MQKTYSSYLPMLGKIGILALVVFSILWVCLGEATLLKPFDFEYFTLEKGWVQLVDGDTIPIASLEDAVQSNSGEELVFETTLPELSRDRLFFLYTENQEVWVYVEDELIYSFEAQDALSILDTPGSLWNRVTVTKDMEGQTLRLVLKSAFNPDHRTLHTAYLIHENEVLGLVLKQQGLLALAAIIIFILAIISYLNAYIWRKQSIQHYLIRLADLYLFIALWLFGELNLYDLIFHRPALSYLLSMLALRILPIVFHQFVSHSLPRRYRIMTALGVLTWLNLLVTCFLQFSLGISFVSLLTLNNCVIGLGALVCIGVIVHCALTSQRDKKSDYFFVATIILILFTMIDVGSYYLQDDRSILIGIFTAVGFALYTTGAHIFLVQKEVDTKIEKTQLEQHVQKLETTTLMEQIKAHFIFNTLNTISALCKIDARQADEAVKLFARYMRSYMYLINQRGNIPIMTGGSVSVASHTDHGTVVTITIPLQGET